MFEFDDGCLVHIENHHDAFLIYSFEDAQPQLRFEVTGPDGFLVIRSGFCLQTQKEPSSKEIIVNFSAQCFAIWRRSADVMS
jgi:hypothetical protein